MGAALSAASDAAEACCSVATILRSLQRMSMSNDETLVLLCGSPDVDKRAFALAWARGTGTSAEWERQGAYC